MGINHGGFDVFMSEQFLDGADVISVLKQMSGKGVSEGVGSDTFVYSGNARGYSDCLLQGCLMDMMPSRDPGLRIGGQVGGGKDILPNPLLMRGSDFLIQSLGHIYRPEASVKVFLMERPDLLEVFF